MHESEESRTSKARERQRRRTERRRKQEQSIPSARSRRTSTQLRPEGGFKLPSINPRLVRPLLFAGGAVVFMVAIIVAVGLFAEDPPEVAPNGYWIGDDWTYTQHADDAIKDLAHKLHDGQVGTVYAHVSELNADGTWTGLPDGLNRFAEVRANVQAFAEQFKTAYPGADLLGTLSIRIDLDEDGYRLDQGALHQSVADFAEQVVGSMGFDGVLLQLEPFVSNDDENLLELIRRVRQGIGETPILAVVVPPDWTPTGVDIPMTGLISPNTVWESRYKQRVALVQVDQIVVRAYNSYLLPDDGFQPADYAAWVAYQVETFGEAIGSLEIDTRVMIAIATLPDLEPARSTNVETLTAGLSGVIEGIESDEMVDAAIQGVAIFADWSTDDDEWDIFKDMWVKR